MSNILYTYETNVSFHDASVLLHGSWNDSDFIVAFGGQLFSQSVDYVMSVVPPEVVEDDWEVGHLPSQLVTICKNMFLINI